MDKFCKNIKIKKYLINVFLLIIVNGGCSLCLVNRENIKTIAIDGNNICIEIIKVVNEYNKSKGNTFLILDSYGSDYIIIKNIIDVEKIVTHENLSPKDLDIEIAIENNRPKRIEELLQNKPYYYGFFNRKIDKESALYGYYIKMSDPYFFKKTEIIILGFQEVCYLKNENSKWEISRDLRGDKLGYYVIIVGKDSESIKIIKTWGDDNVFPEIDGMRIHQKMKFK